MQTDLKTAKYRIYSMTILSPPGGGEYVWRKEILGELETFKILWLMWQSCGGDNNCRYSVVLSMMLWSGCRKKSGFMDKACKKGFELLGDFNLVRMLKNFRRAAFFKRGGVLMHYVGVT